MTPQPQEEVPTAGSNLAQQSENGNNLTPVPLQLELGGRVRNISKPKHWYMAVAEAVKNSMDAIEEANEKAKRQGWIEVVLERSKDLASLGSLGPVQHVTVKDNGVGFTEPNFKSFCRPDSLYKLRRGGKGVGRLVCLQAFRQMQVGSVFQEDNAWKKRRFVFQQEAPELSQSLVVDGEADWLTEIKLTDLREEYFTAASVELDHMVDWLIEHFLAALLEKPTWLKSLIIRDGRRQRDLTELVIGGVVWDANFKVGNYDFGAKCYKLKNIEKDDMVRLVAGGTVVDANTRPLEHYIPHLEKISEKVTHVVLVKSPFFDEHINDARNGVSFCEDGEESALLGITAAQFRHGLAIALAKPLRPHIDQSVQELKNKVEEVVRQEAPSYKPLLAGYFESRDFSGLPKSARTEEILTSIDGFRRREAVHLKKESKRLARIASKDASYWEGARKLASQVDVQKQVALAEYVSLRKIVLEYLENLLNIQANGKASLEKEVHNLIFPQKTDTESDK